MRELRKPTQLRLLCTTVRRCKAAHRTTSAMVLQNAFDIQFTDKDNKSKYPFQTSWGTTTRLIGAIIMTHGDNNGLVLPPEIAPIQAVVVPIATHKKGVLEKANEIFSRLNNICRAKLDITDRSPGWKFAEYEMKGVPLRIEIGPKDIENGRCVAVRRDNGEKITVSFDELEQKIPQLLKDVQNGLYEKALKRREEMTYVAHNLDEIKEIADTKPGFIKSMWCGSRECEDKLKEVAGITSRCLPLEQENLGDKCVCCGKPAHKMIYWGKSVLIKRRYRSGKQVLFKAYFCYFRSQLNVHRRNCGIRNRY